MIKTKPIIKVCGFNKIKHIQNITPLLPHHIGIIFYAKSKRYFQDEIQQLQSITQIKKVGVFVNSPIEEILSIATLAGLDILQLHGEESPAICEVLKQQFTIVKAIGINEQTDFSKLNKYQEVIDYFLFDTASPQRGGTGVSFDKKIILLNYKLDIPYFLSGGLDIQEAKLLLNRPLPNMIGIDINSKFEKSIGEKNNILIQEILHYANSR